MKKNNVLVKMLEFRWTDLALIGANCHDRVDPLQTQPYCSKILIIMKLMYLKIRLLVSLLDVTQRS